MRDREPTFCSEVPTVCISFSKYREPFKDNYHKIILSLKNRLDFLKKVNLICVYNRVNSTFYKNLLTSPVDLIHLKRTDRADVPISNTSNIEIQFM